MTTPFVHIFPTNYDSGDKNCCDLEITCGTIITAVFVSTEQIYPRDVLAECCYSRKRMRTIHASRSLLKAAGSENSATQRA